jgi:hypothetical protein
MPATSTIEKNIPVLPAFPTSMVKKAKGSVLNNLGNFIVTKVLD